MKKTNRFLAASLFAFSLFSGLAQSANAAYPERPIQLIVPFAPGGVTDILGRAFAAKLGEALGQSVVVENRAGAGSLIGAAYVARSSPDGYTLLLSSASNFGFGAPSVSYDPIKDFTHISALAEVPSVVEVPAASGVKSIKDLIAEANAQRGKFFYGTGGIGTSVDVAAALFNKQAGTQIERVAYRGSGPALIDLVANRVQVMFDNLPSSINLIKSGQLRAIAVTTAQRQASLPDVPTVAESGLPDYRFAAWFGLSGPANLPPDVTQRLLDALKKIAAAPDLVQTLKDQGASVTVSAKAGDFAAFVQHDFDSTKGLIPVPAQ